MSDFASSAVNVGSEVKALVKEVGRANATDTPSVKILLYHNYNFTTFQNSSLSNHNFITFRCQSFKRIDCAGGGGGGMLLGEGLCISTLHSMGQSVFITLSIV